jgi:hypothetical protein
VEEPPLAYSLRLRGEAVELAPGHFWTDLRSDGCEVVGAADGTFDGHATCRRELRIAEDGTFSALGEIGFGGGVLTFVAEGRLAADDHARRGTALGRVTGGRGRLTGASGYVASSFLLWASGDVSEDHLGVLFIGRADIDTQRGTER